MSSIERNSSRSFLFLLEVLIDQTILLFRLDKQHSPFETDWGLVLDEAVDLVSVSTPQFSDPADVSKPILSSTKFEGNDGDNEVTCSIVLPINKPECDGSEKLASSEPILCVPGNVHWGSIERFARVEFVGMTVTNDPIGSRIVVEHIVPC